MTSIFTNYYVFLPIMFYYYVIISKNIDLLFMVDKNSQIRNIRNGNGYNAIKTLQMNKITFSSQEW